MRWSVKDEDIVHVHCPSCKNRRLFDSFKGAHRTATLIIKCQRCKNSILVKLDNDDICTEQIAACRNPYI